MAATDTDCKFAPLGRPRRVWTVAAIHGEAERLEQLHDHIYRQFRPGDRLVYLGNYFGQGPQPLETIEELLTFRRMVLSLPGVMASDIVYLRGGQEEMWQKLLQIQFAPYALKTLEWLLANGMTPVIAAYGANPQTALRAAKEGPVALARWTACLNDAVRRRDGHLQFALEWRRAAFTDELLFVHAGIDPARTLEDQGDHFWWGGQRFHDMHQPYDPFGKVVRGYDPAHNGVYLNGVTATVDGGCGFGGNLVSAGFMPDGSIFSMLEA